MASRSPRRAASYPRRASSTLVSAMPRLSHRGTCLASSSTVVTTVLFRWTCQLSYGAGLSRCSGVVCGDSYPPRVEPGPARRAAAFSPLVVSRTANTTRAPRLTRSRAVSRPMPLLAPVTTNVRPVCSASSRGCQFTRGAYGRLQDDLAVARAVPAILLDPVAAGTAVDDVPAAADGADGVVLRAAVDLVRA